MSKPIPADFGISPKVRYTRSKKHPHIWTVFWHLDDRPMEAVVHPDDRAYIEAHYDVQVDTMSVAETYEYLIIKEKPAPAPGNQPQQ